MQYSSDETSDAYFALQWPSPSLYPKIEDQEFNRANEQLNAWRDMNFYTSPQSDSPLPVQQSFIPPSMMMRRSTVEFIEPHLSRVPSSLEQSLYSTLPPFQRVRKSSTSKLVTTENSKRRTSRTVSPASRRGSSNYGDGEQPEETRLTIEKRARNTEASARFRANKKARETEAEESRDESLKQLADLENQRDLVRLSLLDLLRVVVQFLVFDTDNSNS